ncbi:hypothetical protein SCLCIDRAFT_1140645 [Scleroderma citrinum Foug A]|uniref:Uncharacterized protein n=1 Tax=Scleroderma citrinum Foug A TaxID=1036808 RepID=A0A0C3D9C7_9AGAM|nr:hypothetical protein SCLCIDRAFT_1140645 [Scleroderma citrinum Foug A]
MELAFASSFRIISSAMCQLTVRCRPVRLPAVPPPRHSSVNAATVCPVGWSCVHSS